MTNLELQQELNYRKDDKVLAMLRRYRSRRDNAYRIEMWEYCGQARALVIIRYEDGEQDRLKSLWYYWQELAQRLGEAV